MKAPSLRHCWRTWDYAIILTPSSLADHVKHHKPAPDTFLLCAQRMGVQPTQCVVFEDADFGIQAARAAGMDAVDVRLL